MHACIYLDCSSAAAPAPPYRPDPGGPALAGAEVAAFAPGAALIGLSLQTAELPPAEAGPLGSAKAVRVTVDLRPASARALARLLLEAAELLERRQGD
jgi:hypothetical protein